MKSKMQYKDEGANDTMEFIIDGAQMDNYDFESHKSGAGMLNLVDMDGDDRDQIQQNMEAQM